MAVPMPRQPYKPYAPMSQVPTPPMSKPSTQAAKPMPPVPQASVPTPPMTPQRQGLAVPTGANVPAPAMTQQNMQPNAATMGIPSGGPVYAPPYSGSTAKAITNQSNQMAGATVNPSATATAGVNYPPFQYVQGAAREGQGATVNNRLYSDDAFLAAEEARVPLAIQEIRDAMKVPGADMAKLTADLDRATRYQGVVQGARAARTPVGVSAVDGPNPASNSGDAVTSLRSSADLQAQSGDSLAIERAALKNAIDTQMASLRNNFDYANQNTNDQRVLEDQKLSRSLNPFSGRTGFVQSQVARGRQIDDTYRNADMNNQLNSLSAEIANFDKLAPERQRQIYNELLTMERQFGLQQGQLTGNYGGQRTLAGQQFDRGIYEDERNFGYQQGRDTVNDAYRDKVFGRDVQESDRNFNFQKAQQEWENNFKQGQFDFQKAQQTWENTFQGRKFEQDMKEAASSRGLQWASLNQRDKEFIADQAWRDKQFDYQKQQDAAKTQSVKVDAKASADNYNTILDDLGTEGLTKDRARQLVQANQGELSDADYRKLMDYINNNF